MNVSGSRIQCPQCGSLVANSRFTSALDPRDEISLIQEETRRLDSFIYELKQKQVALHRRLNSLQSSTRNIPYEILSSIFRYAAPSFTKFQAKTSFADSCQTQVHAGVRLPVSLASVSSVWRNTALSLPQIWKNLDLNVNRVDRIPFAAALIDFYIKNADNCAFSLNLNFGPALSSYKGTGDPFRPLESVIFYQGHAEKFESLHISPYLASWPSFLPGVPNLVNLSLKGGAQPLALEEHKFPSLRHLVLQNIFPSTSLSTQLWKNLTVLVAVRVPLHFCLSAFTLCPLLREYRVRPPPLRFIPEGSFFTGDVTMKYLQVLEWDFLRMAPESAMLTRLHLPVLKTLVLGCPLDLHVQQQLYSFVSRLPPTLNSLELTHCDYNTPSFTYWHSLLASLHGVQKLTLHLSPFWNCSCNILAVLGSRRALTTMSVLPSLEEIVIEDEEIDTSSDRNTVVFGPAILTQLLDVLEHREKIKRCTLRLNRRLVCDYRLNKLRAGGLDLEIEESGIINTPFLPII